MGHHPPSTGFTWPVPPEDLASEPVLLLEWNDEGRVTVRQEPVAGASAQDDATPVADTCAETVTGSEATAWDALPAPASPASAGSLWNPLVRERATWLGIGTLIGITLAASALPDSPPLDPTRYASRAPDVSVSPPPTSMLPPPAVIDRPVAGVTLAVTKPLPAAASIERTKAPPPAAASARSADATAVWQQVQRYQSALARLDASATHAAWPDADRDALVKQFTALREQRLRLDQCTVSVPDVRATVTCRGVLTYRPRVGDHSTRTTRGTWRFALERDGEQWVIDDVTAPAPTAPR